MKRLLCFLFGHVQSPVIEEAVWRTRKGDNHVRKEYRCECDRCGEKSKWIRWKYFPCPPHGWSEMYTYKWFDF